MSESRVLIIIPAYNEADSIVKVVNSVIGAGYDYVVINDGSTDDTLRLCREEGFRVLDLPENLGIGGAVQSGHKYAYRHGYDIDIQFDGDGQHDVDYVAKLVSEIEKGADMVIGSRFLEKTEGFQSSTMRRVGIRWISFLIKAFTGKRVTDPTSGFRACGRRCIELFSRDYPTDYPEPESIVSSFKRGFDVRDVSVIMHERKGGESSIKALSSVYYMIKVSLAIAIVGLSRGKKD